jgi:hypothetical protein
MIYLLREARYPCLNLDGPETGKKRSVSILYSIKSMKLNNYYIFWADENVGIAEFRNELSPSSIFSKSIWKTPCQRQISVFLPC